MHNIEKTKLSDISLRIRELMLLKNERKYGMM